MRLILALALTICFLPSCFAQTASITPAPAANDTTVGITISQALGAASAVKLYSEAAVAEGSPCVADDAQLLALKTGVPATAPSGSTTLAVVPDKPLAQGVHLCAMLAGAGAGGAALPTKVVVVQAPASPPGFDWGLVRANFTAGGMLSQADGQFGHEDLFLAFRIDKNYGMAAPDKNGISKPRLGTFFETRLTALPVAVQTCNPSISACSSSGSSSTGASSTPATTTETFLNSQKSARLQFGLYYPVYLTTWQVKSKSGGSAGNIPYALYIAPLVKTGFDTTLNGLNQTTQSSSTPTQVQPIGNSSQFYKFYDFGFRVGHDQASTSKSVAPEQISYLDVGWGRYSNLASLLCPTSEYAGNNTCNAPSGSLPWKRDVRMRLEGLLQVPGTKGFSVGFSTNVSFYPGDGSSETGPVHIRPADDLRFLFAYQFDISTIAAKLAPQNF
jgi:hypothetical protein